MLVVHLFSEQGSRGLTEVKDQAGQGMNRVGRAVIVPTVPSGTRETDFKPATGERLRRNVARRGADEHDNAGRFCNRTRGPAKVAHAAEVALPFLSHRGHQKQGSSEWMESRDF